MKAEQELDQKKREAYRILRVRIMVNSPAAVIILSAFLMVMKFFTKSSRNATEYGKDRLLKYGFDLKKLMDRFE